MAGAGSASTTARILHFSLVAGVALVTALLVLVRRAAAPSAAPGILLPVLAAVALGTVTVALMLRRRLSARAAGTTDDAWWAENLGRAIPVWALLESAGMAGAVFYFIGVGTAGLVVAAAALALLVVNGPGRLMDR